MLVKQNNRKSYEKDKFREIGSDHIILLRNLFMTRQRKSNKWKRFGKQEVFAILFCFNVNKKNSIEREWMEIGRGNSGF